MRIYISYIYIYIYILYKNTVQRHPPHGHTLEPWRMDNVAGNSKAQTLYLATRAALFEIALSACSASARRSSRWGCTKDRLKPHGQQFDLVFHEEEVFVLVQTFANGFYNFYFDIPALLIHFRQMHCAYCEQYELLNIKPHTDVMYIHPYNVRARACCDDFCDW